MTLVGDRQTESEVETEAPPVRRPGPDPRRRWVSATALGVVAVILLYAFFASFVTGLWYNQRQRALAGAGVSLVHPTTGSSVGVLQSQSFRLNVEVVQGDGSAQLRSGPGHRPGTPLPGQLGNSVIYGHRSTWGGPFDHLGAATKGSQLFLKTPAGQVLAYSVTAVHKVPASSVVAYVGRSTDYRLTLVTDAGGRFSGQRLVVIAVSGTPGQLLAPAPGTSGGPSTESPLGITLLELAGWLAAAIAVAALLRRTQRTAAVAIAVTPLLLGALVSLFIELGLLWSPLA